MKLGKALVVLVAGWFVSLGLALVLTFVVAGVTSHWGAARAGNALLMLWAAIGLIFLLSGVLVLVLLKGAVPSLLARLGLTLVYLVPLGGAGVAWAFFTMVLFNR
jgi:hypothetical protein